MNRYFQGKRNISEVDGQKYWTANITDDNIIDKGVTKCNDDKNFRYTINNSIGIDDDSMEGSTVLKHYSAENILRLDQRRQYSPTDVNNEDVFCKSMYIQLHGREVDHVLLSDNRSYLWNNDYSNRFWHGYQTISNKNPPVHPIFFWITENQCQLTDLMFVKWVSRHLVRGGKRQWMINDCWKKKMKHSSRMSHLSLIEYYRTIFQSITYQ